MKILVAEKLSEHRYKTPEGYLICVDSILARTGKQTYKRSEIFGDDDERLIEVDRKAEEVFSPETMASFENKPICVEHPDVDVNSGNISEFAVGFVRDIHKGEYEGEPVMLGTLVITDAKTVEEIEEGKHTDLSCGYDCDIDDSENPQQRNIRGNHVALCEQGRAGIARIMDSVDDEESTYTEVTKNLEKEAKKDMSWLDSVIDEYNSRNDLSKVLHSLSKMYSNDPGIEYVIKTLRLSNFEPVIEKINGWNKNRNVPGEYVKEYTVQVKSRLDSKKYEILVELYADSPEWRVKEINSYITRNLKDSKEIIKDSKRITDFDDTPRNVRVVKEFIEKNGNKFSKSKDADKILDYIKMKTGIRNADYGDVIYIIKNYTRAEITDSVKDAEQLYAVEFSYDGDSRSDYLGHVNVRAKSEQDALTKAKRWAVEHYDNPGFFKITSTKYTNVETIDVIKDAKYVIMHPRKNLYLTVGAKTWSDESSPMIKKFDSEKEAEEYAKKNTSDFRIAVFDSVKDAKTEYVFNYHDTYHGTRDKMRVDAKNLDEAIREFGKTVALGGFGTANIYVVSVSPNDGYIRAYGKLSEMLKQKWTRDSVKDSTYKVEYISSGAEIYPIVEVDAASELEAVETVRKKDKKYIRLISVKKKDSAKTLDSKKLLSIVRAVKSIKSNDAKETKLTFTPTNDVANADMTNTLIGALVSSGVDYHSAKKNAGKYSIVIIGDNNAVHKAKLIIENIGFFSKWS